MQEKTYEITTGTAGLKGWVSIVETSDPRRKLVWRRFYLVNDLGEMVAMMDAAQRHFARLTVQGAPGPLDHMVSQEGCA